MREKIYAYCIKYHGDYNKITKAINNEEPIDLIKINQDCLIYGDENYPKELLDLGNPPWVLFYKGNIKLLQNKKIAIVGSRNVCEYGRVVTTELVKMLDQKTCVVSGMAKGIDYIAQNNAYQTIGVVAHGLDIVYPLINSELYQKVINQGLLLSEYPCSVTPKKYYFPFRNRIIVALSKVLIVPQCQDNSGTITSVNQALALDREIYTVPTSIFLTNSSGNNMLILQGANFICDLKEIKEIEKRL